MTDTTSHPDGCGREDGERCTCNDTVCSCCGGIVDPNGECPCDWGWTDCQTAHPRTITPDVPAVWRARVEPGAVVSWRPRSGGRRIRATVVDVLPDALIVDLWGVSRCRMTAADMPGLMVEVRPWPNGGPRYAPGALYGYDG